MRKVKFCLNAMVKDEASVIERMLKSCYKYIDYWVIQDNGSTDGTQDIIQKFFDEKKIPGFLYHTEWHYFGKNRDDVLQKALNADHKCDFILRIDADEQLQVDDDFDWSFFDVNMDVDSFNVPYVNGSNQGMRTWIWNANRPFYFADDKRHETIHMKDAIPTDNFQRVTIPSSFKHILTNDGKTWENPNKYVSDGLTMELEHVPTGTLLDDDYHFWYLAKSYYDGYRSEELPLGIQHQREFARRAIFYWTEWLDRKHNWKNNPNPETIDESAYCALTYMGTLYGFLEDTEAEYHCYVSAGPFAPKRNEHLVELYHYFEKEQNYENMFFITDILTNKDRNNPFPENVVNVMQHCYQNTSEWPLFWKTKAMKLLNMDIDENLELLSEDFKQMIQDV